MGSGKRTKSPDGVVSAEGDEHNANNTPTMTTKSTKIEDPPKENESKATAAVPARPKIERKTDNMIEESNVAVGRRSALLGVALAVALSGFYSYKLPRQQQRLTQIYNNQKESPLVGHTFFMNEDIEEEEEEEEPVVPTECSVYIAPSSLQGVHGFGVYVTRDLDEGESILGAPDGLGIPVGYYHNEHYEGLPQQEGHLSFKQMFDNYWWGSHVPGHVAFDSTADVVDYQIGFGCLPNHHCVLSDIVPQYPYPAFDDTLVKKDSPGIGAFSYNRGREFFVNQYTPAGSEIFLNYGHCTRHEGAPTWLENAYVTDDFYNAAVLMEHYFETGEILGFEEGTDNLVIDLEAGIDERVVSLLPKNVTEMEELTMGVQSREELVRRIALKSLNKRSVEWIKENGICMDNLIAKKSKLPMAGQGGFAQRFIPSGSIVAPSFMMQIVEKDALVLHDEDGNQSGTQLLMNYCFGHKESTLLLCPNTNAVLINHCSSRSKGCGPDGPNAEYRWASGWDPTSDAWRKMSIEEIAAQNGRGLTFEIVALRDIQPGEEVTIDYGEEWEEAWNAHVASWKPPAHNIENFFAAKEVNEEFGPIPDEFISGDLRKDAVHPYLFTACQYFESRFDQHHVYFQLDIEWEEMEDEEILSIYSDPYEAHGWEPIPYEAHPDGAYWPCTVIRRDDEEYDTYTVRIHRNKFTDPVWAQTGLPRLLTNFPREAIHFFVKPFSGDQHLPGVFRHPIGIRDEIFPDQWKNIKN